MDKEISQHIDYDTWLLASVGVVGSLKTKEIIKQYFKLREMHDSMDQKVMKERFQQWYDEFGQLSIPFIMRKMKVSFNRASELIHDFHESQGKPEGQTVIDEDIYGSGVDIVLGDKGKITMTGGAKIIIDGDNITLTS